MCGKVAVIGGPFRYNIDAHVDKFPQYFVDHDVSIIVSGEEEKEVRRRFADRGVETHFMGGSTVKANLRLFFHLVKAEYDLFFVYGSPQLHGMVPVTVSALTDTPVITRFNGYKNPDSLLKLIYTRLSESYLLTLSDASVFLSERQREEVIRQLPVGSVDAAHVIPPGIQEWYEPATAAEVSAVRSECGIPDDSFVVGSVMKPRPVKRLDRAIDIVHRARKHLEKDIYYIVVGPTIHDDYVDKLKSNITELGMENRVIWVGEKASDQLYRWYSTFDVTMLTSDQESFGMPVSESYLCETPCLVTDVGGLADQVIDGETGYCVPPGATRRAVDRLVTLLQDRELNQRFGREGREYIVEEFTLDTVSGKYARLAESLLN